MASIGRSFPSAALLVLVLVLSQVQLAAAMSADPPTLVEIRAAHHTGFDRIVFEFEAGLPETANARWARRLRLEPSHRPAHVQGNAFIKVRLRYALGHRAEPPQEGTFGPTRRAFDLPNVAHLVLLGDSEGQITFGIGLMARTRIIRAVRLKAPDRFVIDISSRYPKGKVEVYFADEPAMLEGDAPLMRPVVRKVPKGGRANGAMSRLYAGPTTDEQAQGLRFMASGTTGYRDFSIDRWGVARVTLRGACDSGGSALMTVGEQISATLKARPRVEAVKIHDRLGITEEPTGRTDSMPFCLEP